MDVIVYDLPERAEAAAYEDGVPLDVAIETAARIAVAEELRKRADSIASNAKLYSKAPTGDAVRDALNLIAWQLRKRADELDPDGAR